jgi:hypothetical protein
MSKKEKTPQETDDLTPLSEEELEEALSEEELEEQAEAIQALHDHLSGHAEPPPPNGQFLSDAEVEKLRVTAEQAAIEKAEAATAKLEAEQAADAAAKQEALLKAQREAEEAEAQAAAHEARAREVLAKRLLDGKARAMDPRHKHESLTRPVNMEEVEVRDLQIYPAHIAAHAILANIHGESYDPFHDNEFSRNPDGSVRCSIKIKPEHGGGHDRFDVHPPDLVKMVLVEKKLVASETAA